MTATTAVPSDVLQLPALDCARGEVRLPGSKSISNRTLLLAALAEGSTDIHGLLHSEDTRHMLDALRKLGVDIQHVAGHHYRVEGVGGQFPVREAELYLGNAGTALRPLLGVLALMDGSYTISGDARMHERPIADLVDGLRELGARIDYLGQEGYPPLIAHPWLPGEHAALAGAPTDSPRLPGTLHTHVRGATSSQYLTALLLALPLTGKAAKIEVRGPLVSQPYVEITIRMMQRFGVQVKMKPAGKDGQGMQFTIPVYENGYQSPGVFHVEGDASSASYFLAAGLLGGGPVRVRGIRADSIQGDVRFLEPLAHMGAEVSHGEDWIEVHRPAHLRAQPLHPVEGDFNHIPDAAMTLAVLALFADGPSTLRNIANWRVKETDRLHAMATELRKLGAQVEMGEDSLRIIPPDKVAGIVPQQTIDTYGDHRMAMCFSLLAAAGVPVGIRNPGCVAKTFPRYFESFQTLSGTRAEKR